MATKITPVHTAGVSTPKAVNSAGLVEEDREQTQEQSRLQRRDDRPDEHVPLLVVAHLVSKHGDQFFGAVPLDEGVEERDPLSLPESGEEGVPFAGAAGGVDGEDALQGEVHPLGVGEDGVFELAVLERA